MVLTRSVAWAGGLVALALLLLAASPLPVASDIEARLALALAPVTSGIRGAIRPAAEVLVNAGQLRHLSEENAALRLERARLEAELAGLREERLASGQLTALAAAVGPESHRYVAATVTLHDPAPSRQVLSIDRGREAGVQTGQPVLGAGATLIGLVTTAEEGSARVRLLTDPASAVSVVVQRSRTQAALAGGAGGLHLEFVPVSDRLAEGDLVLSSALGGRLPSGLPVGRVASIATAEQDLFARVVIEPLTDYRRLEHVLVLTDFRPPPEPGP